MTVALRRELTFDAVMQRIAAGHVPIAETDERLFYELHRDRFTAPEQRTARHILITINDDYSENTRSAARARLEAIAEKLRADSAAAATRFNALRAKPGATPNARPHWKTASSEPWSGATSIQPSMRRCSPSMKAPSATSSSHRWASIW